MDIPRLALTNVKEIVVDYAEGFPNTASIRSFTRMHITVDTRQSFLPPGNEATVIFPCHVPLFNAAVSQLLTSWKHLEDWLLNTVAKKGIHGKFFLKCDPV